MNCKRHSFQRLMESLCKGCEALVKASWEAGCLLGRLPMCYIPSGPIMGQEGGFWGSWVASEKSLKRSQTSPNLCFQEN